MLTFHRFNAQPRQTAFREVRKLQKLTPKWSGTYAKDPRQRWLKIYAKDLRQILTKNVRRIIPTPKTYVYKRPTKVCKKCLIKNSSINLTEDQTRPELHFLILSQTLEQVHNFIEEECSLLIANQNSKGALVAFDLKPEDESLERKRSCFYQAWIYTTAVLKS